MSAIEKLSADARIKRLTMPRRCVESILEPPYYLHEHLCARNAQWVVVTHPTLALCTQHAAMRLRRMGQVS